MDKVKIGFLGCGYMGQLAHLQNYVELPECEVVALCDAKQQQAELVAKKYGIPKLCATLEEMLENPEIEAIVASQAFRNHITLAPEILKAGKHVFTEKPLCIFPENGKIIAKVSEDTGKIHMVGYHKRSDPAVEYAMKVIEEWKATKEVGEMKYVRITMPPGSWTANIAAPIKTDEELPDIKGEEKPSGITLSNDEIRQYVKFVNYYIHQVNLLHYLLGENCRVTYADPSGVLLVVSGESGLCGIIEMAPYSTTDDWQEKATVCFEQGWIEISLPAPLACRQAGKVTVYKDNGGGVYTSPRLPNLHAMKNQAINFIKAVKGEKSAPCLSAGAVHDLEVAMGYINLFNKK